MLSNREKSTEKELTNGPGKLTQALGITMEHNGVNLLQKDADFYLEKIKNKNRRYSRHRGSASLRQKKNSGVFVAVE